MSRSCQSATSCKPAEQIRTQHPRQTRDRLGRDRVALVRHRRRALLARLEAFLDLAHLGSLQVAEFDRHQFTRRSRSMRTHRGYSAWRSRAITWVAATGSQAERVADELLDLGRNVRVGTDRPAQLHDGHAVSRQPAAESGRDRAAAPTARPSHRTSWVRRGCRGSGRSSPCRGGFAPAPRACAATRSRRSIRRSVASRIAQHSCRVDDVGRREPVVDPRRCRLADRRLHDVDERGNVVVGDRLPVEHRLRRTPRR